MAHPLFYSSLMMATGIGIPIMAALSAGLGSRYGSSAFAACVLFMVALLISAVYFFALQGGVGSLPKAPPTPFYFYLGGAFVAFYVLSITWVAPKFGVGNAVAFVLLGQLVSMAAIDQFGLMGAPVHPITAQRAAGLLLMAIGVFMAVRRG